MQADHPLCPSPPIAKIVEALVCHQKRKSYSIDSSPNCPNQPSPCCRRPHPTAPPVPGALPPSPLAQAPRSWLLPRHPGGPVGGPAAGPLEEIVLWERRLLSCAALCFYFIVAAAPGSRRPRPLSKPPVKSLRVAGHLSRQTPSRRPTRTRSRRGTGQLVLSHRTRRSPSGLLFPNSAAA